jgi:hypothetical protein
MAAAADRAGGLVERIFGIDPRALAALRMGLGVVLVVDLSSRANFLQAAYTDAGMVPRRQLDAWLTETIAPFHLLSGSFAWQALLFGVALVFAVLLTAGLRTRVAVVVSWLLLLSLQVRNPFVLNFGDQILRVCMFWALFLPLGLRASLDAARRPGPAPTRPVCSIATAAFLLQVCFVYFFTAILKSGADWHGEGTALYYALQLDWLVRPAGLWLREQLLLTKLLTWSTLAFEYVGPLLLLAPWAPARVLGVLGFAALHLGISATLRMGVFPWIDVVVLLPFLPPPVWDAVETALGRLAGGAKAARPAGPAAAVAPGRRAPARVLAAGLCAVLAYVFLHNAASVSALQLPETAERGLRFVGLHQKWLMFTPNTPRDDGWFVMPGRLADGRLVDLSPHGPELTWRKPARIAADFPAARWGNYLNQITFTDANGSLRRAYVRWLCRTWNRAHPPSERLERVDVFFMHESSPPPGLEPRVEPRYLASHECPRAGERPRPGWDVAVPESGPRPRPLATMPRTPRRSAGG